MESLERKTIAVKNQSMTNNHWSLVHRSAISRDEIRHQWRKTIALKNQSMTNITINPWFTDPQFLAMKFHWWQTCNHWSNRWPNLRKQSVPKSWSACTIIVSKRRTSTTTTINGSIKSRRKVKECLAAWESSQGWVCRGSGVGMAVLGQWWCWLEGAWMFL